MHARIAIKWDRGHWMAYLDRVCSRRQIRQTQFTSAGVHFRSFFLTVTQHCSSIQIMARSKLSIMKEQIPASHRGFNLASTVLVA